MNGSGKKVYQAFQRDRLIMGGEYWPSMINILTTALFAGIAMMRLDWHLLVEALCFGGPMSTDSHRARGNRHYHQYRVGRSHERQ